MWPVAGHTADVVGAGLVPAPTRLAGAFTAARCVVGGRER